MSASVHPYRAPQGRPRAVPPCDIKPIPSASEAAGRPVREAGESKARYAARVGRWMDQQDPARKAARVAKMVATNRKNFLKKKRLAAAATVTPNEKEQWWTIAVLSEATGWSRPYLRQLVREWPARTSTRPDRASNHEYEVFGDVATLPLKLTTFADDGAPVSTPGEAVEVSPPPKPSLWQRIKGWFA